MTKNEALKLAVGMHQTFNKAETTISLEFELCEYRWRFDSNEICYIEEDGTLEDFEEGNCYSLEICYISYEDEDFLHAKVDNGCGDRYYVVFLKENLLPNEDD
ncbi:hypothetical protein pEaSNUABM50_00349 [Erwinia phage pEa_SNUABM_50]|nr:hypothetical protein FDH34_gp353 [Serratia phage BF]QOI71291.1 hypothetical protein pEaSNUABM12_00353 [Erwinia phage pEa_SNUABM_12]QOI72373.1 hypothetical protein pEaSNUABM50_00349 [Erwinia phage pEa_SNUABM_50]QXO11500.1 hypothetical protein pEaSNUABM19_00354 [Erwinia phage pEa_SNUABM_19]QXO12048.1 hypothetical protein pEaSNUABM44_00352 [Erwinia phage pEa_SNUABM_44]AQW88878.1 hypothetical protein BF_0353 [Serratia phage BF]